jgi:hypothetical protein
VEGGGGREFLPPEPAGPEPELGDAPGAQPQQQAWAPPAAASPPPQQQAGWQQQPPPPQQPPPGWGPQPGWQPPPPGWQPWGYSPAAPEPDNGAAVAGFVTSLVSAALLAMSFGFLGVITLIASPFGIYFSRKGKQAIAEGKTHKHANLAQAGFVIGIIVVVLSLLAVIGLVALLVFSADDTGGGGGGGGGDNFDSTSAAVAAALRLVS